MIERETVERQWPLGQPTPLHQLMEQVTLVKGWTQLVTRYSTEEWLWREDDIRKGLTRIDAASAQIAEMLAQVLPSGAEPALEPVAIRHT